MKKKAASVRFRMKCRNLTKVQTKLRTQRTSLKGKWSSRMIQRKKEMSEK